MSMKSIPAALALIVCVTYGAAAQQAPLPIQDGQLLQLWPGAAPATIKGAMIRIAVALLLLQVGAAALGLGDGAAPALAVAVVVGVVVPVLTYAFLASLWFLKLCADQVRGAI